MSIYVRFGWLVALATFAADQISKNIVLYGLNFKELGRAAYIELTPFFNLVMAWNYGVSFGLFPMDSLAGRLVLIGFSVAVAIALAFWLRKAQTRLLALGLGLIIGGALGNVVDRALYGAVADFFDFHVWGYHWYIFNVADAGIVCGVGVLLLDSFLQPEAQAGGLKTVSTPRDDV